MEKPDKDGQGVRERIKRLDGRYGILRAIKFGIASIVGFLVAEAILSVGVLLIYGKAAVPSGDYSSVQLIALNVAALVIGVTIGFFVNESTTVKRSKRAGRMVIRLLKFQLSSLGGNAIMLGVELALLALLGVSPIFGNIVGAVVSFPFTYFVSMKLVWKMNALAQGNSASA